MQQIEKGKIPPKQLLALVVLSRLVTMTIAFPMMTNSGVGRDAWIASLISGFLAFILSFILVSLSLCYQDKTIFEYSELLLGKVLESWLILFLCGIFFMLQCM